MEAHIAPVEDQDDDRPGDPSQDGGQGQSLLDQLREQRRKLSEERSPLELEVPGYNPAIVIRYKAVTWDTLSEIGRKAEKSKSHRKVINAQADTMVRACDEILVRVEGKLVPFNVVFGTGEEPVRFDQTLAQALDFEAETARQALFKLFQNDVAVSAQEVELMEWIRGAAEEDDEKFVGESEAART